MMGKIIQNEQTHPSQTQPVGMTTTATIIGGMHNTEAVTADDDHVPVHFIYEIMKNEENIASDVHIIENQEGQQIHEEEITTYVEENNTTNLCSNLNRLETLSQDLKQLIVKHNLSLEAANDMILALNNYGINLSENSLQITINDMQKSLKNMHQDINEIKNFLFFTQNDYAINLPINEKLDEINEKLGKEPAFVQYFKKVIKIYRPSKGKCPNSYGLSKTFSDKILEKYNWDGSHGKRNFQNLKYLNRVLFDAWGGETTFEDFSNYAKSIRNQFTTARIRRHKRVSSAKARESELTKK